MATRLRTQTQRPSCTFHIIPRAYSGLQRFCRVDLDDAITRTCNDRCGCLAEPDACDGLSIEALDKAPSLALVNAASSKVAHGQLWDCEQIALPQSTKYILRNISLHHTKIEYLMPSPPPTAKNAPKLSNASEDTGAGRFSEIERIFLSCVWAEQLSARH